MPSKKTPQPDISALKSDPVEFIRTVLKRPDGQPADPHPAQEVFLRSIRKQTVAPWGRQAGKSVSLAWYVAWYAVTKPNKKIYIIAPTLDQARIIFNETSFHFETSLKSLTKRKPIDFPFPKILLKNGSEIHARGANSPQYIRGKNAHLIICDEAAFMKDRTITDVIQPMQTVTGKDADAALILISTPFGEGAFKQLYEDSHQEGEDFHEGTTDLGDHWSYGISADCAHFNFPSSSNPHADRKFLAKTKARYGEDSLLWRTEYLAEFCDDETAVIPWAQIRWAYEHFPGFESEANAGTFPLPPIERHRYVQGADLANRNDYFVSAVLDITDPNAIILTNIERFHRRGYAAIKTTIASVYQRYHNARTLVDATSMGESVVEDIPIPVEGYSYTNKSKYEIVQELARLFAEHRILIPYDRDVITELRYFEYIISDAKVLRMEAKRGHDDIVNALALAAHLAMLPAELGLFQAVTAFDPPTPTKTNNPFVGRKRAVIDRTPEGYQDPFKDLTKDTDNADDPLESLAELWPV